MNRGVRHTKPQGPGSGRGVEAPKLRLRIDERSCGWTFCPLCWGQRRIWEPEQAANGEGQILFSAACPACLGIGEAPAVMERGGGHDEDVEETHA